MIPEEEQRKRREEEELQRVLSLSLVDHAVDQPPRVMGSVVVV